MTDSFPTSKAEFETFYDQPQFTTITTSLPLPTLKTNLDFLGIDNTKSSILKSKSTCPIQSVNVDIHSGISQYNSRPNSTPSYGLLIHVGTGVAQIGRQLCTKCDMNRLTPMRQTLRAYEAALRFTQSLSIPSASRQSESTIEVKKPFDGKKEYFKPAILKFYTSTLYPQHIQQLSKHTIYGQLVKRILTLISGLVLNGSRIKLSTRDALLELLQQNRDFLVASDAFDYFNEHYEHYTHADMIAQLTSYEERKNNVYTKRTFCITCQTEFTNIIQLAKHFRQVHLNKSLNSACQQHDDCFDLTSRLHTSSRTRNHFRNADDGLRMSI